MSHKQEEKEFKYLDTPDGHDVGKKMWYVAKPAGATAFGVATADVILLSHPKGYGPTLWRYVKIGGPILASSLTFVAATNSIASLRKKDDRLNWFLGGFAAGSVLGTYSKKRIVQFNVGMLGGILGVVRKIMAENGWVLIPPQGTPLPSQGIWAFDYSLTKERPRNWTTGE